MSGADSIEIYDGSSCSGDPKATLSASNPGELEVLSGNQFCVKVNIANGSDSEANLSWKALSGMFWVVRFVFLNLLYVYA